MASSIAAPAVPSPSVASSTSETKDASSSSPFTSIKFDNLALRALPIDTETKNFVRPVAGACFSRVEPTPVVNPRTVAVSPSALALIDLPGEVTKHPEFAEYFSGNKVLTGAQPSAHCYCGHQFGSFAGQLGDGATMYLGEVINRDQQRIELQFKGAGKTPYSRTADGRKVLRSSIREFLCSEAMHSLGIPTTRSATCVTSDTKVERDMYYTGNVIHERATIITRLAQTFIRFGSFEIVKPNDPETHRAGPSAGRKDILQKLLDYTISTFYPSIWTAHTEPEARYLAWYEEIIRRTARLVADWMCVGWCHGVLNTDNMSIVGVTIDYGPFAFLDRYDSGHICNGSDDGGRYAFKEQPDICKWNCAKLGEAIQMALPLSVSRSKLAVFDDEFQRYYLSKMRQKLGLLNSGSSEEKADEALIKMLFDVMETTGADFTNTFRSLHKVSRTAPATSSDDTSLTYLLTQCSSIAALIRANRPKIPPQRLQMLIQAIRDDPSLLESIGADPGFIMREVDKFQRIAELKDITSAKKTEMDTRAWQSWLNAYRNRLVKEYSNCSNDDMKNAHDLERIRIMKSVNPRVVLRNYMAQNAIEMAEKGDFSEVQRLVTLLSRPFDDVPSVPSPSTPPVPSSSSSSVPPVVPTSEGDMCMLPPMSSSSSSSSSSSCVYKAQDDQLPPDWAGDLCVTCSS